MKLRSIKSLAFLSSTVVLALALAGCGGQSATPEAKGSDKPAESGTSDEKAADGTITLDFWSNHPGTSKATEEELIKKFEAAHEGVKVKLTDAGKNYEEVAQKYNAALAGGTLPDMLVVSDVTWFNFALNDQIEPLDELTKKNDVDTSDYIDALYNDYTLNGKHYAIPYARSTPVFYYNQDAWAKAGLPDRGPKTWDELVEWAPKVSEAMGGKPGFVIPPGSNYLDWYSQGLFWSKGASYSKDWTVNINDEKGVAVGKFLQKAIQDKAINLTPNATAEFSAGEAGSFMQSTGDLGTVRDTVKDSFKWNTAFLPGWETTESCPTGGAGIAVAAGIDQARKDAAIKFIEFYTNPENTVIFTHATGYMPVRKSASDIPEQKEYMEKYPQVKVAIEQLAYTKSQDAARVFVPGGGAKIGGALDKIAAGEDVQKVFDATAKELQEAIDKQIKPKLKDAQ